MALHALALLGWVAASAGAAPLERVRSADPLPAREVERSLVAPMGWSLVELTGSQLAWRRWTQRSVEIGLRHGITRRVELWADLAVRDHSYRNDRATGFGGPALGARGIAAQRDIGGTWLAWELGYRASFGANHPNPDVAIPVSGPTPEAWGGFELRQRAGALRVDLGGEVGPQLPGTYGQGIAGGVPTNPANACLDWWTADTAFADWGLRGAVWADGLLQGGPLLFSGGVRHDRWADRRYVALDPARNPGSTCTLQVIYGPLDPVTPRSSTRARVGGGLQLSRGVQLRVEADLPVAGERARWAIVEHLPGPRARATVEVAL